MAHTLPPVPYYPPPPYQVYNSPSVSDAALGDARSGAWRVHAAFDRHLRAFLSLLPPAPRLDLRAVLARLDAGHDREAASPMAGGMAGGF